MGSDHPQTASAECSIFPAQRQEPPPRHLTLIKHNSACSPLSGTAAITSPHSDITITASPPQRQAPGLALLPLTPQILSTTSLLCTLSPWRSTDSPPPRSRTDPTSVPHPPATSRPATDPLDH